MEEGSSFNEDTYFCCEACGTLFESLDDIRVHIETEHNVKAVFFTTEDETCESVTIAEGTAMQPNSNWITDSSIDVHSDTIDNNAFTLPTSSSSQTTAIEQQLPIIPNKIIEEVVAYEPVVTSSHNSASLNDQTNHVVTSSFELKETSNISDTNTVRSIEGELRCPECTLCFLSTSELKKHQDSFHGVSCNICQLCGKSFMALRDIIAHLTLIHKKPKNFPTKTMFAVGWARKSRLFPCEECCKLCATKALLREHVRVCHSNRNRFICPVCLPKHVEFASRPLLDKHIATLHSLSYRLMKRKNASSSTAEGSFKGNEKRFKASPSGTVVAQGFTVSNGLELSGLSQSDNEEIEEETEKDSNEENNATDEKQDDGDDFISMNRLNHERQRQMIANDLIVTGGGSNAHNSCYYCAICNRKFQDKAIITKHILVKHLQQSSNQKDLSSNGTSSPPPQTSTLYFFQQPHQPNSGPSADSVPIENSGLLNASQMSKRGPQLFQDESSFIPDVAGEEEFAIGAGQEVFLEGGDLISVEVGQEVVLTSEATGNASGQQMSSYSQEMFLPYQNDNVGSMIGGGLVGVNGQEELYQTNEGEPTRKTKRYACPDCSESFKKFVKLQSHIEIKHPHTFATMQESAAHLGENEGHSNRQGSEKNGRGEDENDLVSSQLYQMEVLSEEWNSGRVSKQTSAGGVSCSSKGPNSFAVSNERPYLCQECGKAYKLRSHLSQHIRYHTGEKPFKCDICGQSFHLSGDRNRHVIKMHSDYRPHKCPHCPKAFVDRYALNNHMKFHANSSNFKCEYCEEQFPSKSLMKQHRVSHFF